MLLLRFIWSAYTVLRFPSRLRMRYAWEIFVRATRGLKNAFVYVCQVCVYFESGFNRLWQIHVKMKRRKRNERQNKNKRFISSSSSSSCCCFFLSYSVICSHVEDMFCRHVLHTLSVWDNIHISSSLWLQANWVQFFTNGLTLAFN